MSGKEEGTRECCGPNANCCCCRVEWAMWGNMNALYAAASEYGSMSELQCLKFAGRLYGATNTKLRHNLLDFNNLTNMASHKVLGNYSLPEVAVASVTS